MGGSWYHPYAFHVFSMMLGVRARAPRRRAPIFFFVAG